jgi:hypothetical protein
MGLVPVLVLVLRQIAYRDKLPLSQWVRFAMGRRTPT